MIKVLIVDDEPKAIELINSYLSHFSGFELIKTFRNGLKALEFVNTEQIDVVFLDINMPHLSGLSLSKMISKETAIVFTTAYSEHAVESYEINAIDYLLKPISLERFSKTITKLLEQFKSNKVNQSQEIKKKIFIKSGLESHQISIENIFYLEKDGNYIYYITADKKIMARQSIAEALSYLTDDFIQIQKSYIINFNKIESIGNDYVKIKNTKIPIGVQFKNILVERLKP